MSVIEITLLMILCVTGGYCAISDYRTNVISNRLIVIGLSVSLILQCVGTLIYHYDTVLDWLLINLIADGLSIALYFTNFWAAGDSKLFILMFASFPASFTETGRLYMALIPYVYIFLLAMIWLLADTFLCAVRHSERLCKAPDLKSTVMRYGMIMLEVVAFRVLFAALFPEVIQENIFLFSVVMFVYAYFCGSVKWMTSALAVILHVAALIILFAFGLFSPQIENIYGYLAIIPLFLFRRWASLYNYRRIAVKDIRPGMILSASSVLILQSSRVHELPVDMSESIRARLKPDEVDALNRWSNSSRGQSSLIILRKIPFAMFIVLGFVCFVIRWLWV